LLRSSPICCPRRFSGRPAFACVFLLVAILSIPLVEVKAC
jgi:hypothetical protein